MLVNTLMISHRVHHDWIGLTVNIPLISWFILDSSSTPNKKYHIAQPTSINIAWFMIRHNKYLLSSHCAWSTSHRLVLGIQDFVAFEGVLVELERIFTNGEFWWFNHQHLWLKKEEWGLLFELFDESPVFVYSSSIGFLVDWGAPAWRNSSLAECLNQCTKIVYVRASL